ncbi:2Fe-2S iron-sulfur cluster-binding protein [Streptomyces sp. NRRL S-1521]|uniref:2Fe-2S iron-sulfur cluster-binding protein n=1 Tax=Streptomyces sp. NRRL S-1521 TaxID=1609100 RepID=UPI0007460C67|nr:2Fe-2S iron-sulfur cluster-binding protein [Streptomyces sp. NRRL S-1521]KUL54001.1 hypothetical protein ADL30_17815 [Streptomyces sp. NRRL S-1521]
MSDERSTDGGGWQPHPQGEYDSDATAFVQLPEGMLDAPLAAPGHGYVPPPITITPTTADATDPAATGAWVMPPEVTGAAGAGQWPDAATAQEPEPRHPEHHGYDPGATGQWTFTGNDAPGQQPYGQDYGQHQGYAQGYEQQYGHDGTAHDATGHDVTGQWSIPVAGGDLPDESGEYSASSLAADGIPPAAARLSAWAGGGTPPATLPGGAPAPWATGAGAGAPWDAQAQDAGQRLQEAPERQAPEQAPADGDRQDGENPFERTTLLRAISVPAVDRPASDRHADRAGAPEAPGRPEAAEAPVGVPVEQEAPTDAAEQAEHVEHAEHAGPGEGHDAEQPAAPSDTAEPAGHFAPAEPAEATEPAESTEPAEPASDPDPESTAPEAERTEETEGRETDGGETEGPETEAAAGADEAADAAGAAEAAVADEPAEPPAAPLHDDHPLVSYVLRVNGTDRPVSDAWIGESLLYVLRERLGLAGAKDGCSQGECGACNVQVDGRLVASCLVPAATTEGSEVRTVEGLAVDGRPSDVQRALGACGAVQCGFCVPGMAMTVHDLLEGNPAPTDLETRRALCGNLCRCSGYRGVLDAVREVVAERAASAAAEQAADEAAADEHGGEHAEGARIPHQAGPGAGGVHQHEGPYEGGYDATYGGAHAGPYETPHPYEAPRPYEEPHGHEGPEGPQGPYGRDGGRS